MREEDGTQRSLRARELNQSGIALVVQDLHAYDIAKAAKQGKQSIGIQPTTVEAIHQQNTLGNIK